MKTIKLRPVNNHEKAPNLSSQIENIKKLGVLILSQSDRNLANQLEK